jgi:hypothetical protein
MDNLNISLWGFLTFVCYALIFGFFARFIASQWPDGPVSKALLFIN